MSLVRYGTRLLPQHMHFTRRRQLGLPPVAKAEVWFARRHITQRSRATSALY